MTVRIAIFGAGNMDVGLQEFPLEVCSGLEMVDRKNYGVEEGLEAHWTGDNSPVVGQHLRIAEVELGFEVFDVVGMDIARLSMTKVYDECTVTGQSNAKTQPVIEDHSAKAVAVAVVQQDGLDILLDMLQARRKDQHHSLVKDVWARTLVSEDCTLEKHAEVVQLDWELWVLLALELKHHRPRY